MRRLVIGLVLGTVATLSSIRAAYACANPGSCVATATVAANCHEYTLTVTGELCGSGSVAYIINAMPIAGASVPIQGSIAVTGDASCRFTISETRTWPPGFDPSHATLNGIAIVAGTRICFPADPTTGSFECGPDGRPLFEQPVGCQPKTITMGPYSMEGAIRISNGDWVNGGYSLKSNVTRYLWLAATNVSITGPCSNGGTDTVVIPLADAGFFDPAGMRDWLPTGDANSVLSWQGSVRVGVTTPPICGGIGKLDASKGAVFKTVVVADPPQPGSFVTFRFKFRDPAAKGKPNTNCLDTSDPNRNKADVCGASWSATKTFDP